MDEQFLKNFYQTSLWNQEQHPYLIEELLSNKGLQSTHTPLNLCAEIIGKLGEYTNLANAQIAVLFNLEFVDTLIRVYRINPANIVFFADSELEAEAARVWYKVECPNELITWDTDKKRIIMPNIKKKFDVVVMNPPYQGNVKPSNGGKGSRNSSIWPEFVKIAFEMTKSDGFVAAVHPPRWRKPEDEIFSVIASQNLLYLEMHSKKDGVKVFGAMTPYDWYIAQKSPYCGRTFLKDFNGDAKTIDIQEFCFLPHFAFDEISSLLAKKEDERCEVMFGCDYHTQRPHMSSEKAGNFKYPCIHSTSGDGIRFWYSSKKEVFFGIPKVIFGDNGGDTGIVNLVVDDKGEFGITQHAIGIPISSENDGKKMKTALESKKFKRIINACQYGGFQIDWRMFKYFRKDFWKEFI